MCTYLQEDRILFSCDFFGSHLATSSLYVEDEALVYESAKRYYAEIMMPFRTVIKKNLEKLDKLQIDMIAPSHGPVYNKPAFISTPTRTGSATTSRTRSCWPTSPCTRARRMMVEHFSNALIRRGIIVKQFNLTAADLGRLAIALVDAATIVLGSPTVLTGAHPKAAYAAFVTNALRPKTRFASIIGSFGWGGKMVDQLAGLLTNLKVELLPPVIAKGQPKDEDFVALDESGRSDPGQAPSGRNRQMKTPWPLRQAQAPLK